MVAVTGNHVNSMGFYDIIGVYPNNGIMEATVMTVRGLILRIAVLLLGCFLVIGFFYIQIFGLPSLDQEEPLVLSKGVWECPRGEIRWYASPWVTVVDRTATWTMESQWRTSFRIYFPADGKFTSVEKGSLVCGGIKQPEFFVIGPEGIVSRSQEARFYVFSMTWEDLTDDELREIVFGGN